MIYLISFSILFVNVVNSLLCKTASPANCIYNSTCVYETKECHKNSLSNIRGGVYCSTLIKIVNDEIYIGNMDCMYDQEINKRCKNQTHCLTKSTRKNDSYLHCCCDQQFCNLNFTITNSSQSESPTNIIIDGKCEKLLCKWEYVILLCSIIGFIIIILIILCFIYRKTLKRGWKKIRGFFPKSKLPEKPFPDPDSVTTPLIEQDISSKDLQIGNIIKRGRFSLIHKGFYKNDEVAIKMLTDSNGTYEANKLFLNEKSIYLSPSIQHSNILKYYGSLTDGNKYYLITEFSFNGSLRDVLHLRLLNDEKELILICQQISSGVEYLHQDFRYRNNDPYTCRPPIAHRDLKTDNILYINNEKLVICDFAMSIKLDQTQNFPNEQQQIGTPRYMSPEILAGTIGSDPTALLQCDVYALGIILWEILSRYPTEEIKHRLDSNEMYEMPFDNQLRERHLSCSPSINDMLQIINLPSPLNRPLIRSSWKESKNKNINTISETMGQCWDQIPEGRIRAALVALRMQKLSQSQLQLQ
ncbi:unnamed protein product [Adineta steineri]|uniref:receptor protein serine/threonine kinase n=1 Tax=Adineta steineri TaxID=433720 RepID=A0A814TI79_9BILA|nr:unnamed protein product [Adineta steineri]CAF1300659.1 unnamed protein product [Adineta steineri]